MDRGMLRRLFVLQAAILLAAFSALAQERADAVLVLADDGALDAPAARAIRNAAASELRRRGIALAEDRRTSGVHPLDEDLSTLALDLGAHRLFALRIGGRLGQKIPISLDELSADTLVPVHSASLTATGLEECDVVTARLVDAVLGGEHPRERESGQVATVDDDLAEQPAGAALLVEGELELGRRQQLLVDEQGTELAPGEHRNCC